MVKRNWHRYLALVALLALVGCKDHASGGPDRKPIVLTFASSDPSFFDATFVRSLERLSGGLVTVVAKHYRDDDPAIEGQIAQEVAAGRLDLADVGSRAWESFGVRSFRAYQTPFLLTNDPQLIRATASASTERLLSTLAAVGVKGLAVVPVGLRYVFSSRPLTTPAQFAASRVRINPSATTTAILASLGAQSDDRTFSGQPTKGALAAGLITGVESDMRTALANGYVRSAPYVLANAPLFAKTATLVASAHRMAGLSAEIGSWLNQAAAQADRPLGTPTDEAQIWAAACANGLKPIRLTPDQLAVMQLHAASVTTDIAADLVASATVSTFREPTGSPAALDLWATCRL